MSRTFRLDWPALDVELELDEEEVMGEVGRAMAAEHRRALTRGVDSTGRRIQGPDDGGAALRATGELIGSIRGFAVRRRGRWMAMVAAVGGRSDVGSSLRGRNAALLGVQIYGRRSESQRPRNPTLMALSRSLLARAGEAVEEAFERGEGRLVSAGSTGATRLTGLAARAFRRRGRRR